MRQGNSHSRHNWTNVNLTLFFDENRVENNKMLQEHDRTRTWFCYIMIMTWQHDEFVYFCGTYIYSFPICMLMLILNFSFHFYIHIFITSYIEIPRKIKWMLFIHYIICILMGSAFLRCISMSVVFNFHSRLTYFKQQMCSCSQFVDSWYAN